MILEDIKFKCNGNDLDSQQLEKISGILLNITLAQSKERGRFLFRGDNFESLCKKLKHQELSGINSFNDKLFMVGDKGKAFYKNGKGEKIKLEDITKEVFVYIFDRFNKILEQKNKQVGGFGRYNTNFVKYFKDKVNKANFCSKILSISDDATKKIIRDYYLVLLHQYGYVGFKDSSFFLSTTTSFAVAENFSPDMQLVCWFPKGKSNTNNDLLNHYELPSYNRSFYPNQREVSLVGGVVPHYILGYIKDSAFELNPNIFKQESLDDLIAFGLSIDQTNFLEVLNTTNYYSGFVDNGAEINTITK